MSNYFELLLIGTLPLMGGLLQEEGTGRGRSTPRPLFAVPNVTATDNGQCTNFILFDVSLRRVVPRKLKFAPKVCCCILMRENAAVDMAVFAWTL